MGNFDEMRLAVKSLSGGKNDVILDDVGMPSIMVVIPKFLISDVITGGSASAHPAFKVDGVEKASIMISKFQNIVQNGRAYSLPLQDPAANLTFDQAVTYSTAKGVGWHLMTNAEWAAVALWCKKNGFMPRGNNNYGADIANSWEKGVQSYPASGATNRVATGSGPASWAHDGSNDGIFDLNGNVWEWVGGLRLQAGEIQIVPDNNAAGSAKNNLGAAGTAWKAMLKDGTIVDPGTALSLKWDYAASKITLCETITTQADVSRGNSFETAALAAGVTVPEMLKALSLHPLDASHGGDYMYMNNGAGLERLPYRGGSWNAAASAGVFALYLGYPRTILSPDFGFRSAYVL